MDWVRLVYLILLLICGILVFVAPLYRSGDERRKYITAKARSYAFTVTIGVLTMEVGMSIYQTIQGSTAYHGSGGSPISFLSVILIMYLVTFLIYKKRYGN